MPGIFVFSEEIALLKQLLSAGLELKESMKQPLCAITTDADGASNLVSLGAEKVYVMKGVGTWPEGIAKSLGDFAAKESVSVLLIGGTRRGKDIAARVAARLKAGLVTDAQKINFASGALVTTRMIYGGLALSEDTVTLPALVTIPPRTFAAPAMVASRKGDIQAIDVAPDTQVEISNVSPIMSEGVDITAANKLVCVGRGFAKKEDLKLADALAKALGAEVACTRPVAEDLHWMPVERYVGISGAKVEPLLYLAVGVSGQIQHVAGIRGSKCIVAVNIDEHTPIFEAADYGIVGDLYEVLPLLTQAIQSEASKEKIPAGSASNG
jgi:electron transfer flavoprotein alpha subunit